VEYLNDTFSVPAPGTADYKTRWERTYLCGVCGERKRLHDKPCDPPKAADKAS